MILEKNNCYKSLNCKSNIASKNQKLDRRQVGINLKCVKFLISHNKMKSASVGIFPSQDSASGCFLWMPSTNLLTNNVFEGKRKTSHHNISISKFKNKKTS